ncbi:major coat protein [Marinobacterium litorale]|uniref:major coat protein n=1 Tax=Marinobacterium litorale TaxID=404770 RepID=UPI00040679A8|nr:major coat protein [Marinobacterium litorale]
MSMKDRFTQACTKSAAFRASIIAGLTGLASSANAALPASIGTELTAIETDALALADLVWPVVITLFGALILFKLFKRFGSQI